MPFKQLYPTRLRIPCRISNSTLKILNMAEKRWHASSLTCGRTQLFRDFLKCSLRKWKKTLPSETTTYSTKTPLHSTNYQFPGKKTHGSQFSFSKFCPLSLTPCLASWRPESQGSKEPGPLGTVSVLVSALWTLEREYSSSTLT